MFIKRFTILGCLIGASFFIACQQEADPSSSSSEEKGGKKELKMRQDSELALLMQSMYEQNLDLRERIIAGDIPESFPEDFKRIHSAQAGQELSETYDALALEYIRNMEEIVKADTPEQGRKAYNTMINTCASCHQIYCQGPLGKIKKMRIPVPGKS